MRYFLTFALLAAAPVMVMGGADAAANTGSDRAAVRTLSNESTLSRWAHPEERATVRRRPSAGASQVGRLHLDTEDGLPEVYLVLRGTTDSKGHSWVEVRLPSRPNGRTGWVPRGALGPLRRNTMQLKIDRRTLRATLTRRGKAIWRARVGVGKSATPTPAGSFYVRERLVPPVGSIYGALAFGLSAYARVSDWPGGGVVGIHGTDQPQLIPGRPSSGCIRIRASDLRRLGRLLRIGTPVRIV
ncbi:MAG: L,D-transpeptidase [Solirubrobacterales bacterium]|nr:L,D-transpeptidase [Solirubrobacterales bacterium]